MNNNPLITENLNRLRVLYPVLLSRMENEVRQLRESKITGFHIEPFDEQSWAVYEVIDTGKRWIHGPDSPVQQAEQWISTYTVSEPETIIVWRSGLGYVPRFVYDKFPQSKMIVCENRLELIWESLCRWDNHWMTDAHRCLFISDENILESILKCIHQYPLLFSSNTAVIPGSVIHDVEWDAIRQIQEGLIANANAKSVCQNSKTICIMSRSPNNIFSAVQRGIESNGYAYKLAERPPALSGLLKEKNAWKETCGCVPEMALAFYGSIFSQDELVDMGQHGVKRVCWFYDRMYDLDPSLSDCYDLVLTFDRRHIEFLQPLFGERVRYLPAAAGMETFQPNGSIIPPTSVTFVGATGLRRSMQYIEQNRAISMQLLQIINRIISAGWSLSPTELQKQLDRETRHLNPENEPKFTRFVLQLAASRLRISYLSAAQFFGLTIYGDALWGKREMSGHLVKSYAGHSLDYETQTPEVYAASAINLNLFHPQIVEGIPMRVYDVLACGGFLLSQYRPVLEEQFTIGKDLDVFHNPSELAEKIRFYLQHEDQRREMAAHGRETVLQHHTYRHRIRQIMQWIQ